MVLTRRGDAVGEGALDVLDPWDPERAPEWEDVPQFTNTDWLELLKPMKQPSGASVHRLRRLRRFSGMVAAIGTILLAVLTFTGGGPAETYELATDVVTEAPADVEPEVSEPTPAAVDPEEAFLLKLTASALGAANLGSWLGPPSNSSTTVVPEVTTTTTTAPEETSTSVGWSEPEIEPQSAWTNAGNGVLVPDVLLRIRFCESTNDYQAAHSYSSARGAYQFLRSSWEWYGHAARYGAATADLATPAQQDEAAVLTLQRDGTRPWLASWPCWGSDSIPANYATAAPRPRATTTTTAATTETTGAASSTSDSMSTTTAASSTSSTDSTVDSSSSTSASTTSTTSSTTSSTAAG